ncbi:MAG: hypothetical protein B6D64_14490 [Bacteroidetes bacterium 4484_276]|nr:MAG: hypothetical protein B6D64_14490 [Bacteroidetes bacterium 4484_276]OYT13726.1 MAG: hypothetical protein B6I19_03675 [Bacteroidetes bacterium 4572_114]
MAAKRKKKRKPTKYKTIAFKITARQKKSLEANCKARKTTPLKLIKKSIQHYLSLKKEDRPPDYVTSNQLDLFDEELYKTESPEGDKG